MSNYYVDHIVCWKNGDVTVTGEQYDFVGSAMGGGYGGFGGLGSSSGTMYHFNDIAVIKLSPAGKIKWATRIAKRQYSKYALATVNGEYASQKRFVEPFGMLCSYILLKQQNSLYFIFNDTKDNLSTPIQGNGRVPDCLMSRDDVPMLVSMDQSGKATKIPMFKKTDKTTTLISPASALVISPEKLMVYEEGKTLYRFGTVTLK